MIEFIDIFNGKYDRMEKRNRYKLKKIASHQTQPKTKSVNIPPSDWQKNKKTIQLMSS